MSVVMQRDEAVSAAEFVRRTVAREQRKFHTAVILGSGLGAVGDIALSEGGVSIAFRDVPGMPIPRVDGHAGRLVVGSGRLDGVLLLQGRVHHYEGHSLSDLTFAVRMLHHLGIQRLVITNAAGGIHPAFTPGSLMLIEGHIDLLHASSNRDCCTRAPSRRGVSVWSTSLLQSASEQATPLQVHRGVYAWMSGPNYETPAEVRMLRVLGADAVGMSTVPEALCAAQLGMDILGVSCITNIAAGLGDHTLSHEDVGVMAGAIAEDFRKWLFGVLSRIGASLSAEN